MSNKPEGQFRIKTLLLAVFRRSANCPSTVLGIVIGFGACLISLLSPWLVDPQFCDMREAKVVGRTPSNSAAPRGP